MSVSETTAGRFKEFSATGDVTQTERAAQSKTHLSPGYAATGDSPSAFSSRNNAVPSYQWLTEPDTVDLSLRERNPTSRSELTTVCYRLPTEAQWDHACRAGTAAQYSFGDDHAAHAKYGCHAPIAGGRPHPVGTKLPIPFGLFDMHGNRYEWCADSFERYWHQSSPTIGPTRPATGSRCVLRGGSWNTIPSCCRSAFRGSELPEFRHDFAGFRSSPAPRLHGRTILKAPGGPPPLHR